MLKERLLYVYINIFGSYYLSGKNPFCMDPNTAHIDINIKPIKNKTKNLEYNT